MKRTPTCRAVGFDLGETLVHYAGLPLSWQTLYPQALARVAEVCAVPLTEAALQRGEEVLARYNTRLHPRLEEVTADRVLGEVIAAWGIAVPDGGRVEDAFFGCFRQTYALYPDTAPTLQGLKNCEVKVGVLTDVPYGMPGRFVEADVAQIAAYIDAVLTSVEVGWRKPHPRGYLALAERLGVAPQDMVFVGNEAKDIGGTNAAGMASVLIVREGVEADFGQVRTVASLEELTGLQNDFE